MPGDVALVYSEALGAYNHGRWHPLQPRRVALTVDQIRTLDLIGDDQTIAPQSATDAEITAVHSPRYVEVVKRLGQLAADPENGMPGTTDNAMPGLATPGFAAEIPEDLHRALYACGFASADNPIFPAMHEAAALVAGASLTAARLVAEGRFAHAFNPAGGLHHAMRDSASGFCVYNDVAIAAAYLKALGHRVAVVDVDVHHGDGTEASFYTDPNVLTVSLHGYYRGFFPGTGAPDERGAGAGRGANLNVPLPPYTWDEPWLDAFLSTVPAALERFRPTVLLTQDGCDTHRLDPLAELLCSTRIWPVVAATFHELAHTLCEGRWVALGGGGYAVEEVVPRAWTILFAGMAGRPERAAHLVDPAPTPPGPEAQERIWPLVRQVITWANQPAEPGPP